MFGSQNVAWKTNLQSMVNLIPSQQKKIMYKYSFGSQANS